jgi:hypothetical protein
MHQKNFFFAFKDANHDCYHIAFKVGFRMQSTEAPAAEKNLNFPDRPPCDEAALAASIYGKLVFVIGKSERCAERRDWFLAAS